MMVFPKRIKIDVSKDEAGNVLVIVADENIDKGQRLALMEAAPAIAALPLDGSFEVFLVEGDIVLEGRAAAERKKRIKADGWLAEKLRGGPESLYDPNKDLDIRVDALSIAARDVAAEVTSLREAIAYHRGAIANGATA